MDNIQHMDKIQVCNMLEKKIQQLEKRMKDAENQIKENDELLKEISKYYISNNHPDYLLCQTFNEEYFNKYESK